MCDCLEQEIVSLGESLTEEHNGRLQVGPGEFRNVRLENQTHQPVFYLPIRFLAVNLETQALQHYDSLHKAKYCPFCGEKYLYLGLEGNALNTEQNTEEEKIL